MREVRSNPMEYFGTADELAAMSTTNLPSGTRFYVFDATDKVLTVVKVYVESVGDWCKL